jgi:hypothetical protein
MNIGQVINRLADFDEDEFIYFDFCNCVPTGVNAWRGIHAEPALGWSKIEDNAPTVKQLIAELEEAVDGRKFTGYKGGEYVYSRESPLHIDNWGESSSTRIKSIKFVDGYLIIKTKYGPA